MPAQGRADHPERRDLGNPAKMQQFQAAQGKLSGALSRLLVVAENYPDLKANQNFRDLQHQLEGTENRINVRAPALQRGGADLQHLDPAPSPTT